MSGNLLAERTQGTEAIGITAGGIALAEPVEVGWKWRDKGKGVR